jgi:protein-S-isoprenylcysteine O-methyltransferase Ste14
MRPMELLNNALRTLLWAAAFLWFWSRMALWFLRYDSAFGGQFPAWTPYVGVPVLVAGAALTLWCVVLFVVRGRGTPAPFDAPREFVAVGPYRYVRNPMYLGGFAMLIGWALMNHSPAMLAFVAIPALCVFVFVRAYEEPTLEKRFGESYREYKRRVRAWLPNA